MTDSSADSWERMLRGLHTWKSGGQRAVHKPLLSLLLIGRAEAGLSADVRFSEVAEPLEQLLRRFGPARRHYHPEYPFWHLQRDGFWRVEAAGLAAPRSASKSPSRGALQGAAASGRVPERLWHALVASASLRSELASRLLDEFWPRTQHDAICAAVGLPGPEAWCDGGNRRRQRDPGFRDNVVRAYERRCAICGYDGRLGDQLLGLDAAHVKWHAYSGPDTVENALALCSFHHVALDAGAIGLTDDYRVLVSADVCGQSMVQPYLLQFAGHRLRHPQQGQPLPRPDFLQWHRRLVFKGPERPASYTPEHGTYSMAADETEPGHHGASGR